MRPSKAFVDWAGHWAVLMLAGALTGLLGGVATIFSNWLASIREGHCDVWYVPKFLCCRERACTALDQSPWSPWVLLPFFYIFSSLLFALAATCLIADLAPAAAVDGVPELRSYISGNPMPSLLSPLQIIVKLVATSLAQGSGLWIGPDSPMVHIAASIAACLAAQFNTRLSPSRARLLIASVSAAGLAVAMGSPIGGVLFVVETLQPKNLRGILWQGFVCAMTANLFFEMVNPFESGKVVFFQVVYDRAWHGIELIPFVVLGALGGLFGRFIDYTRSEIYRLRVSYMQNVPQKWQSFALVGSTALVTSLLSFTTVLRIPMHELLAEALHECSASEGEFFCRKSYALDLTYTCIVALLLTPASYGLGTPSGIMLPTVTSGALIGRLVGLAMQSLLHAHRGFLSETFCPGQGPCITPGVYALVGAAAALTGATKLTISSAVILFELTGAVSYVVPIMSGVMVAKWVVDYVGGTDVYHPVQDDRVMPDKRPVPNLRVRNVMKPATEVAMRDVQDAKNRARHTETVLVNSQHKLVGYCPPDAKRSSDVRDRLPMDATALVAMDSSVLTAAMIMEKLDVGTALVTDRGDFMGLLNRESVAKALREPTTPLLSEGSVFEISG